MTLAKDTAWKEIEARHEQGAARRIARRALELRFEDISSDAVHMAKRCLLDAIGCGIGAYSAPGRPICEAVADELGGNPEATLFGSGKKTSSLNAIMVNSFLVRYLDYNDLGGGGHNSDAIPALLAAAESESRSGKDLLTAIVLSYELGQRFLEAFSEDGDLTAGHHAVTGKGWCSDIRGGINMTPSIGILLGLNEEQIAGAIGDTIVRALPLNHLDANDEEFVMSKNLRFGFVAYHAMLACKLARRGFTGPQMGIEGEYGFNDVVLGGALLHEKLDLTGGPWRIMDAAFKSICANFTTHTSILSTIALAEEYDLSINDVEKLTVIACEREAKHTTTPAKKYPRNGESADHSLYFGNAFALRERHFGPAAFKPENFEDGELLEFVEQIDVEVRHDWPSITLEGGVRLTLRDGRILEKIMEHPKGWNDNPMTDLDLENKFIDMAVYYMPEAQARAIVDEIWSIDTAQTIAPLMNKLQFPNIKLETSLTQKG